MPPSPPIADPLNVLHVYRHLLREITYLPPPAQPWVAAHAAQRFRSRPLYKDPPPRKAAAAAVAFDRGDFLSAIISPATEDKPPKQQRLSDREHELTLKKRLYKAHGAIWRLRAANSGHAERMLNVLFQAFGRRGRRRRELVEELVYKGGKAAKDAMAQGKQQPPLVLFGGGGGATTADAMLAGVRSTTDGARGAKTKTTTPTESPETDEYADIEVTARSKAESRWDWLEKWDTEKLKVYIKSQKAHESSVTTSWPSTATLRTVDPAKLIPELNIWQRPWHPKTYRTKLAKAWKRTVDKVQPPVSRDEWDMIRRIALNEDVLDAWKIPPRRTPVTPLVPPDEDELRHAEFRRWEALATKPIRHIERPKAPRNIRLSGETDAGPYGRDSRGPAPDGRWIRRVFLSLWNTVSVVEKDPATPRETITWGKKKYRASPASPVYAELFRGVDAKGAKLPTSPSPSAGGGGGSVGGRGGGGGGGGVGGRATT